ETGRGKARRCAAPTARSCGGPRRSARPGRAPGPHGPVPADRRPGAGALRTSAPGTAAPRVRDRPPAGAASRLATATRGHDAEAAWPWRSGREDLVDHGLRHAPAAALAALARTLIAGGHIGQRLGTAGPQLPL